MELKKKGVERQSCSLGAVFDGKMEQEVDLISARPAKLNIIQAKQKASQLTRQYSLAHF